MKFVIVGVQKEWHQVGYMSTVKTAKTLSEAKKITKQVSKEEHPVHNPSNYEFGCVSLKTLKNMLKYATEKQ